MEGSDIMIMVFSMLLSFLLGVVGMLFIGGKTILNYFRVRAMRGKGLLIFLKTSFGWKTVVGRKKENNLVWKHDKILYRTSIEDVDSLSRYGRVDSVFINLATPTVPIKLEKGNLYPDDFDPEVYNNILLRAQTRPNPDGTDDLKKLLLILLVLGVISVFALLMIYIKLGDLAPQVASAVI